MELQGGQGAQQRGEVGLAQLARLAERPQPALAPVQRPGHRGLQPAHLPVAHAASAGIGTPADPSWVQKDRQHALCRRRRGHAGGGAAQEEACFRLLDEGVQLEPQRAPCRRAGAALRSLSWRLLRRQRRRLPLLAAVGLERQLATRSGGLRGGIHRRCEGLNTPVPER